MCVARSNRPAQAGSQPQRTTSTISPYGVSGGICWKCLMLIVRSVRIANVVQHLPPLDHRQRRYASAPSPGSSHTKNIGCGRSPAARVRIAVVVAAFRTGQVREIRPCSQRWSRRKVTSGRVRSQRQSLNSASKPIRRHVAYACCFTDLNPLVWVCSALFKP